MSCEIDLLSTSNFFTNASDIQSLVATVDALIFSHREHLDDLQQAILEGAFDHQKYAKIAKNNHCSEKYINELEQSNIYQQAKLEAVTELVKEGLSIKQIARVLKLPLELVQEQIQHSE